MNNTHVFIFGSLPRDKEFHKTRVMFAIIGDEVVLSQKGNDQSHTEWFKSEGWINDNNREEFLSKIIRGIYFPPTNSLYFYKGAGFFFDDELIKIVINKLYEIKTKLNLSNDTKVCFGPKDKLVHGIEYEQKYEGELGEFQNK